MGDVNIINKLFDLADKTALITGASRGPGLQMAEASATRYRAAPVRECLQGLGID